MNALLKICTHIFYLSRDMTLVKMSKCTFVSKFTGNGLRCSLYGFDTVNNLLLTGAAVE